MAVLIPVLLTDEMYEWVMDAAKLTEDDPLDVIGVLLLYAMTHLGGEEEECETTS